MPVPGLSGVVSYLSSNWVNLFFTLVLAVLGGVATQRYIRQEVISAEKERHSQAMSDVLDVLENCIINERDVSEQKINNLVSAVDRKHSVSLSDKISQIALLQDLELRIEERQHLDQEQKENYVGKIEDKIRDFQQDNSISLPVEESKAFDDLKESIRSGDEEAALQTVQKLEKGKEEQYQQYDLTYESVIYYAIRDLPGIIKTATILAYTLFMYFVVQDLISAFPV